MVNKYRSLHIRIDRLEYAGQPLQANERIRITFPDESEASKESLSPWSQIDLAKLLYKSKAISHEEAIALADQNFSLACDSEKSVVMDHLQELGQKIYNLLFPSDLERRFEQVYKEAIKDGKRLRLCINITDDVLRRVVPWEALYAYWLDPQNYPGDDFKNRVRQISIVRFIPSSDRQRKCLPLTHVGLFVAEPPGESVDRLRTQQGFQESFANFISPSGVIVEDATDWNVLTSQLHNDFELIHFLGHGKFENGESALRIIKGEDGKWCAEKQLLTLFSSSPRLRLLVLQACQSGLLSYRLVKSGVPAVIGMQYKIIHSAAGSFASDLYDPLLKSNSLDGALSESRIRIAKAKIKELDLAFGRHQWLLPILVTTYDEIPLRVKHRDSFVPTPHLSHLEMPDVQSFVGREHSIQTAAKLLDQYRQVAIVGRAGIGKSYFGAKVACEHTDAQKDIYWFAFKHAEVDVNAILWDLAVFLYEHDEQRPYEWLQQRSREAETVTELAERQNYVVSFLGEKGYVFCFDNMHLMWNTPAKDDFLALFNDLLDLESTTLLVMSRESCQPLPQMHLQEMAYSEFAELLTQKMPDFPETGAHLLSVDLGIDELNKEKISGKLRRQFQEHGKDLTQQAQVRVEQSGNRWVIIDGRSRFLVRNENESICIYRNLRREVYEKLSGVPQYLKLFADMVHGGPLTSESIQHHLADLPVGEVETYMLEQICKELSSDEQWVFSAISIFRQPPDIVVLTRTLQNSGLLRVRPEITSRFESIRPLGKREVIFRCPLKDKASLGDKIRIDLSAKRKLFRLDKDHVFMHDIEREFWLARLRLNQAAYQQLHQAVVSVYDSDNSILPHLEAAHHAFEAGEAMRSCEILQNHREDLISTGHASEILNQLEKFQDTQFGNGIQIWIDILMWRGSLQRHLGRYQDAADSHKEAYRMVRRLGGIELRARALIELGRDHIFSGENEHAIRRLNQAKRLLRERNPDHHLLLGAIYCRLAEAQGYLGDFEQAIENAQQSVDLLKAKPRSYQDYCNLVWAYHAQAQAYIFSEEPDLALKALQKAKDIVELEVGLSIEMVYTFSRLGFYYRRTKEHTKARDYFQKAIDFNKSIGELERQVGDLSNLGQVFHETGNLLRAEQHLQDAFKLAFRIQSAYRFNVAFNLSILLHSQGRWLQSAECVDIASKVADMPEYQLSWRMSKVRLQRDWTLLSEVDMRSNTEPAKYWAKALQWLEEIQVIIDNPEEFGEGKIYPQNSIESFAVLGEVLACAGYRQRLKTILPDLEEQQERAKSAKLKEHEGHTWQALGIVYAVLGSFSNADQAFMQALSLFEAHTYEKARTYYYQGRRYILQKEYTNAEKVWQESLDLFESLTAPGHKNDNVFLLETTLKYHGFSVPKTRK